MLIAKACFILPTGTKSFTKKIITRNQNVVISADKHERQKWRVTNMTKITNDFIGTTVEQAKQYLRDNADNGAICPCCKQMVKVYIRRMHHTMLLMLINLYKLDYAKPGEYHHLVNIIGGLRLTGTTDFALLAHWGLTVLKKNEGNERGRTSGMWLITQKGKDFVENKVAIPSHIKTYNAKCLGYTGEYVKIADMSKEYFDYKELMGDYYRDPNADPVQQSLV